MSASSFASRPGTRSMRIFLAGATGVIGRPLAALLVAEGHDVVGLGRSAHSVDGLRSIGVVPVVGDVFDAERLTALVMRSRPEAIIDELTNLPDDPRRIAEFAAANARIRREGTRNLIAAARAAHVSRFVSQSVAWPLAGDAGAAVEEHERMVLDAGGVVVRYGRFYGAGTYHETDKPEPPRVEIDEAAARTLEALTMSSGILTIVDPDP
jgi:nucleoside-diphosphate-sugar epimerase